MPRKQNVDQPESGTGVLDAFAVTKDHVPAAFQPEAVVAPVPDPVDAEEAPAPKRAGPKAKAKRKPKPDDDKPVVKRMGRRKTGRNVQFNQTVTPETANAFYEMQSRLEIPMGAVLERAIEALEAAERKKG